MNFKARKKLILAVWCMILFVAPATSCYANNIPIDSIYHGSPNNNLDTIKPNNKHVRAENEGAVIFATPSLRLASCYLFRWDDSWVHQFIDYKNNDKTNYEVVMVISDKNRFRKYDKGGTIYILPSYNFKFEKNKGLGIYEWTSKKATSAFARLTFASALEAMQKLGVTIYFITKDQFEEYKQLSPSKQQSFLLDLVSN